MEQQLEPFKENLYSLSLFSLATLTVYSKGPQPVTLVDLRISGSGSQRAETLRGEGPGLELLILAQSGSAEQCLTVPFLLCVCV